MVDSRSLGLTLCGAMLFLAGCGLRPAVRPDVPLKTASTGELVGRLNERAGLIRTLRALVTIRVPGRPIATGALSYARPETDREPSLRLKGFDPIGRTVFDLVSDGVRVRISIPSSGTILEILEDGARDPSVPIRPSDLNEAVSTAVGPVLRPDEIPVLEQRDGVYILHLVRISASGSSRAGRLTKRLWFDRADLRLIRVEIVAASRPEDGGQRPRETFESESAGWVETVLEFSDYSVEGGIVWPRRITVLRPGAEEEADFPLVVEFREVHLNRPLPEGEFRLP